MPLRVLQDVPDVAGAQPQAPGGGDGVLGGDVGVGQGQPQIPRPRLPGRAAPGGKCVVPLLAVGAENQHHGRPGDEGLVVAGVGQGVLEGLVGDIQDGVELLVAGGGGGAGRLQHGPLHLRRHGGVGKGPDGLAGVELRENLIHDKIPPRM